MECVLTKFHRQGRGALAQMVIATVGTALSITPRPATAGSPRRRCPDMTRMRNLIGYSARVGLEDGVRRTYDWYRTNAFEPGAPRVARSA